MKRKTSLSGLSEEPRGINEDHGEEMLQAWVEMQLGREILLLQEQKPPLSMPLKWE